MTLDRVGPILSRIAQRIVLAPPTIDPPSPRGGSTSLRRFQEGLLTEEQLRRELADDGYAAADIERWVHQGVGQRALDDMVDRMAVIQDAYAKDAITDEEMDVQVRELIVDAPKAALVIERLRFGKRPKPKPPTPERIPTLTTAQVLAAWAAGLITDDQALAELAKRNYSESDAQVLLALQASKAAKPKAAARKTLTLAELNAMLPLGIITPEEYVAELTARGYSSDDAQALLGLQVARALARAPEPPAAPAPAPQPALPAGGAVS